MHHAEYTAPTRRHERGDTKQECVCRVKGLIKQKCVCRVKGLDHGVGVGDLSDVRSLVTTVVDSGGHPICDLRFVPDVRRHPLLYLTRQATVEKKYR